MAAADDRRATLRRRLAELRRQLRRGVDGVALDGLASEGMAITAKLAGAGSAPWLPPGLGAGLERVVAWPLVSASRYKAVPTVKLRVRLSCADSGPPEQLTQRCKVGLGSAAVFHELRLLNPTFSGCSRVLKGLVQVLD